MMGFQMFNETEVLEDRLGTLGELWVFEEAFGDVRD